MTREEYLKELNKAFGDFKFFEEDHHYEYKGKKIELGVTTFIGKYANEFDSQTIAKRVAKKRECTLEEVLKEWDYKRDFSCEKGTNGHCKAQSLWNGEIYHPLSFDGSETFKMANEAIYKQAIDFYNDYKDKLEHLADEYVIGDAQCNLASCIDHIFINRLTKGMVLVDYKTNSEMYKNEKYAKPMKAPLQHLKDTKINHYALQLSIYKYLVETHTNLKFEDMFIVWFSELNENYQIVNVPYLKNEVETILEWRKWE